MSNDAYFNDIAARFTLRLKAEPENEWPRLLRMLIEDVDRNARHEAFHKVHDCASAIFNMRYEP